MANKTKKVSINAVDKIIKENYPNTNAIDWNGIKINIKKYINFDEMRLFVSGVVDACFSKPSDIYMPANKNLAIRVSTIELYTNITLPSDIHKAYDMLYASDLWDVVMSNISQEQFSEITSAINEEIANIINYNLSVVNKNLSDLYGAVDSMQTQISSLFDGVKADDLQNIMKALSNNTIDEDKLMKAYLDNIQEKK